VRAAASPRCRWIDEPQHRRPPAVDALGPRAGERAELRRGAEGEDATAADGDRLGDRPARVERQHPRVLEEPVGAGRSGRQSEDGSGFASFTFIS
jgi:hypothetical protein